MDKMQLIKTLETLVRETEKKMLKGDNSIPKNIELNGRLRAYKEILEMIKIED